MRLWTGVAGTILLLGIAWGAGFVWFEQAARAPAPPLPPVADGIVALTGGAERIDTALRLLVERRAPELLISGVGRGSDLAEIARRAQLDTEIVGLHVTLGHGATSTVGNATETASWAGEHHIVRLIVVTAGYHMLRALLEIRARLPQATLFPVPVQPPAMRGGIDLATIRLLVIEYDKFLAVRFGVAGLFRREAAR